METKAKKTSKVTQELPKLKWDDKAIDKLEITHSHLKGRRDIPFATTGSLKGAHIRWNRKTNSKTFIIFGKFRGKTFNHKCGEYLKGSYGTFEANKYINQLVELHKDRRGWKSNPNAENVDEDIIKASQQLTIRECIVRVSEAGYPRILVDGSIALQSIRDYSRLLMGYNKRREYLKFTEDDEGCGGLELTHGMTWSRLFKKYPAYKGCTEDDKRSLYDSQLGALDIDKLTPKIVQNYCNKGKTYGARVNTLKAFQYLWRASNKLNLLGDNDVLDPTRKQYGGVTITKSKKILFKGHRYTNMKFKENQLERLIEGCYQLRDKHPFQIEAIMFMLYTFRRQIETTKIDYSCVGRYGDQPRKNVITMPFNITKSRVEEYVVITDRVQEVLDSLHYQRSKEQYKKYKHIKWLFPNPHISTLNCGDVEFCQSDKARCKYLETAWKKLTELTGIDGQKKLFRKSGATISKRKLGSTGKARALTGHQQDATLDRFYDKTDIDETIEYAQEVAKVYQFKK
jgi:hypothetical protein